MQPHTITTTMPKLPNWRLAQSLNPLTVIAKSAGFDRWETLVEAVRGGEAVTVDAPDLGGRSTSNAYLFRDACEAENLTVGEIIMGRDGQDRLTLQVLAS